MSYEPIFRSYFPAEGSSRSGLVREVEVDHFYFQITGFSAADDITTPQFLFLVFCFAAASSAPSSEKTISNDDDLTRRRRRRRRRQRRDQNLKNQPRQVFEK